MYREWREESEGIDFYTEYMDRSLFYLASWYYFVHMLEFWTDVTFLWLWLHSAASTILSHFPLMQREKLSGTQSFVRIHSVLSTTLYFCHLDLLSSLPTRVQGTTLYKNCMQFIPISDLSLGESWSSFLFSVIGTKHWTYSTSAIAIKKRIKVNKSGKESSGSEGLASI